VLCVGQFGACLVIVRVCCVWENLERVWGIDFVLCVGEFCVGLGNECVLCVEEIGLGFGGVCMCCVWDRLWRFWRIEFVLRVVEIGAGLGE